MLARNIAELYRGGPDWERELEAATAQHGMMDSLLGHPRTGAGNHKPPRKTLLPFPSGMMGGGGGAAPFTFGFDGVPGLTNELWGGFPSLGLGNVLTAGPTTSGIATKLWVRAGSVGITADVRVNIYATSSASDWDALLATGTITGGIAANATASVTVGAFTIANGVQYGIAVQASANNVNFASVGTATANQWWVDGYADGAMNPGPNPTNSNGFNRAPAVWCSN